jgi:hypothetical protein
MSQVGFDDAEGGFRSQVKILEDEIARKEVISFLRLNSDANLWPIASHVGNDKTIPEGTSLVAKYYSRIRHADCPEPARKVFTDRPSGAFQLAWSTTKKRKMRSSSPGMLELTLGTQLSQTLKR